MQQYPENSDRDADKLPTPSEGGKVSALALARRNQQLSLDLRSVPAETAEDEDEFKLLDYWRILVKRKWTVLAVTALVLVIGFVATLMTTPIYRSTAVLQLERSNLQVVQVGGVNAEGSSFFDSSFQQTQIELLKSRALAERVVSKMGLAQSGELDGVAPGSAWQRLVALVRGRPDEPEEAQAAGKGGKASKEQLAGLASAFRAGLTVEPVRDSELVRLNYDSPDPRFSQRAANAVAEVFVGQNLERRFDSTSYAKNYLEDRLQELKLKLEDSERKLVEFAQKEQIVSAGGDNGGANLIEQNLGSLNAAYAKAKEDRIRAEARWHQSASLRGTGLQNSVENPMIKTLQESRAKLLLEYQDKLRLYKPDYPVMQQLKSQIDEIETQIRGEEGNIRSGIQADYQAALQQEQMLASQLNGLKGDVLDLQKRSIQYNILKRDVDTNRQLYDGLLQRYKEIGIASGVSANNISLVDRAEPG